METREFSRPRTLLPTVRQTRLATGLVLFTYVTTHFINHALGNVSIAAMESGLKLQKAIWQSLPGAVILYAAFLIHMCLGFSTLYSRRDFRFTRAEATQLVLGLTIPFLLVDHFLGTRVSLSLYGTEKGYAEELLKFWVRSPFFGVLQGLLLLIVWIHGCIGIWFWLRLKRFYHAAKETLFAIAILIPVLALLGNYQGGRLIQLAAEDANWVASRFPPSRVGTPAQNAQLVTDRYALLGLLAVVLLSIFLARGLRTRAERRRGMVTISFLTRSVRAPVGLSVLEACLRHDIPHAHVCGGRGRCSTCRIRVISSGEPLPPISPAELTALKRFGAGAHVRLACQLRPTCDVVAVALLSPDITAKNLHGLHRPHLGEERVLAIMFVDMRDSSKLAENCLPFDTVFIFNQFLDAVSRAVVDAGGAPNQILGDGLLALFGLEGSIADGCRQAIAACASIANNVSRLNIALSHDLANPLRFGIGVHVGPVIVGDIGYQQHAQFTVIGDAAHVAARLQENTKRWGCEALISQEVCLTAGGLLQDLPEYEVVARGRESLISARGAREAKYLAVAQEGWPKKESGSAK